MSLSLDLIKTRFDRLCQTPSSINEHLPRLRDLASQCATVAELGVDIGQSTTAFLLAQPQLLVSVDLIERPDLEELKRASSELWAHPYGFSSRVGTTEWIFQKQDTRTCSLPPIDLLFIDTTHTYTHLKTELEFHAPQTRRYIVLHDTVSYGTQGEIPNEQGLLPAISAYLATHPEWQILESLQNNNGLQIWERAL